MGTVVLHNFTPHLPGIVDAKRDLRLETQEDYGLIRLYVSHKPRRFYLEVRGK